MNIQRRDLALEVNGLSRRTGSFTLDGVSIDLPRGSITALTGLPGSGKSLTLKLILGFVRKSAGKVHILGRDATKQGSLSDDVGFVVDPNALISPLRADELSRVLSGIHNRWNDGIFMQLLRRFSLPDNIKTEAYSPSQRAMLSLAAALSHGARLLLLDDILRGAEAIEADEICECLLDFAHGGGSVLIATRELDELDRLADRVVILHRGKKLLCEDIEGIYREYALLTCPTEELAQLDGGALVCVRSSGELSYALVHRADFEGTRYTLLPVGVRDVLETCIGEEAKA